MELLEIRRQHISWTIQQNPLTITINRTEKIEKNGCFEDAFSTVGPFEVRIFTQKSANPREVSTLAGTMQVDKNWGMLASFDADLRDGPNVIDEFDAPGFGHFKVVKLYPQIVMGQIAGYQVDLEAVE